MCWQSSDECFDRLLNGVKVLENSNDMSLEEAEKKYGDEIIKRFLSQNGVADVFSLEEVDKAYGSQIVELHKDNTDIKSKNTSRNNQKKAIEGAKAKGSYNRAVIIKSVLEGMSKSDIEYSLGFSRSTIDRALRGLTEEDLRLIWKRYKASVFNGVDIKLYYIFVRCDCNYRKYRKEQQLNSEVAFRQSVEKEIEKIKSDREVNAFLDKVSDDLVKMGFSPLSRKAVEVEVEEKVEEEVATLEKVISICQEVDTITMNTVKQVKVTDEDDRFIEKIIQVNKQLKRNPIVVAYNDDYDEY